MASSHTDVVLYSKVAMENWTGCSRINTNYLAQFFSRGETKHNKRRSASQEWIEY
ncbi:hypothetical protein BE221DRAFT_203642 [Ostreococcus tauri]|uniref:Uncharacterized protein n=1 Tax=Ostreococcus tauri TaxID=70448 RepID=A0A1Y5INH8_OSTTA|nr:hypothetical protein BE221DRAFT_203642 [Ostreococcus tauri]